MIHDAPATSPVVVTAGTLEHLRRAKPWVRLVAVLTFIGAALLVAAGLLMSVMGSAIPGFSEGMGAPFAGAAIGIVYLLIALLYVFPGLYLWRYANAIDSMVRNPQSLTLEEAIKHQTSFWRFVGIMTVVVLILYALIFVFAVVFGAMGALGS